MLISFAGHTKVFSKKLYLSGMKYDIKNVKNDVFVKYVTAAYVTSRTILGNFSYEITKQHHKTQKTNVTLPKIGRM